MSGPRPCAGQAGLWWLLRLPAPTLPRLCAGTSATWYASKSTKISSASDAITPISRRSAMTTCVESCADTLGSRPDIDTARRAVPGRACHWVLPARVAVRAICESARSDRKNQPLATSAATTEPRRMATLAAINAGSPPSSRRLDSSRKLGFQCLAASAGSFRPASMRQAH